MQKEVEVLRSGCEQHARDPNCLREVMNELKIALELTIICDWRLLSRPDLPTDKLRIGRDSVVKHVMLVDGLCRGQSGHSE
jgi:hypothetical protein